MRDTALLTLLLTATAHARGNGATDSRDDGRKLPSTSSNKDLTDALSNARDMLFGNNIFDTACTADMSNPNQPTAIDEATCLTQTDSSSQPCVWCDLGFCVSPDQKEALGQFWDQLCGSGGIAPAPEPVPTPPLVTPSPTNAPTPPPTVPPPAPEPAPAPAPEPAPSPNDAFACVMDSSSNVVTDEATCVANPDTTSTTGQMCVWCEVPILGGSCITNAMHDSVGFMCKSNNHGNLRAGGDDDHKGWNSLDPSCLGDSGTNNGFGGDEESCGTKSDVEGNTCIWCDGAGVLGLCVSPLQKDYLSGYLDCADYSSSVEDTDLIATE